MKTIVLDDDPTGTQSATGVTVLFGTDADLLTRALQGADSVYVQTNSRALSEEDAVVLVGKIKADGEAAAQRLGEEVRFVLRGDSTLRGHVFAESAVFLDDDAIMLFVPAFPDGGRTTRGGSTTSTSRIATSRPTKANTHRIRCSASRRGFSAIMSRRSRGG